MTRAQLFAVTLLSPAAALAGPITFEFDAVGGGRGTAAVALYDNSSAAYYNPANITRLDGLNLNLGVAGIMPRWEYVSVDGLESTRTDVGIVTPPALSLSYKVGNTGHGDLALGLAVNSPYGGAVPWPNAWAGRTQLQELQLQTIEVSPVVAFQPSKKFSLGAGLRVVPASIYLRQAVRFGSAQEGQVEMGGRGTALGAAAGIGVWPTESLSLGLAWRSATTLHVRGDADFQFDPPFDTAAQDRDARTDVPLPQVFRFGAAYDITKALNVSADLEYQMWETFKELRITLVSLDGSTEDIVSARDSKNSYSIHAGGQYKVTEDFAVRLGYIFDQATLPEETVAPNPPDSNRHVVSVGASYYFGRFGVHLTFADAFMVPRTTLTSPFPAEYRGGWPVGTMAYVFGLGITAHFDAGQGGGGTASKATPRDAGATSEPAPPPEWESPRAVGAARPISHSQLVSDSE